MPFKITGCGSAVPEFVLTNEQLTHMVETSDEWITTRTGIRERRICTTETITDLATSAAQKALVKAGVAAEDIDLIICSTIQAEYITPSLACLVQEGVGAQCPAFDVNAACTGFLYALDIAAGYFERGRARKILVVAAETMSRLTDWTDRSTCVLFGDAAGAVVLEPGDSLLSIQLTADGGAGSLNVPGASGTSPFDENESRSQTVFMNGQDIYKFAVNSIVRDVAAVMKEASITPEDVDFTLLHQANKRILDTAQSKLPIDPDTYIEVIGRYGNISSASIPLMLDELTDENRINDGDLLVLSAFGAGLTTGAAVLRW